jgi:hypothetical protein
MRRLVPLAALLALAALAPSPSFADAESDRVTCFSLGNENYKDAGKFDIGLAACSRMIDSGRYKDKGLASIYRARASWKEKKRDLDAALQEYDRPDLRRRLLQPRAGLRKERRSRQGARRIQCCSRRSDHQSHRAMGAR